MTRSNFLLHLRTSQRLSERDLALHAGISRMTLRSAESGEKNLTLHTLQCIAKALNSNIEVLITPETPCRSSSSSIAVSLKMIKDGFQSWPYHLMELVDDFRATKDARLFLLPPDEALELRLKALMASTISTLCEEVSLPISDWAKKSYFLPEPWFISETESLKASAILESPLYFRKNNIFVQENFLKRV